MRNIVPAGTPAHRWLRIVNNIILSYLRASMERNNYKLRTLSPTVIVLAIRRFAMVVINAWCIGK